MNHQKNINDWQRNNNTYYQPTKRPPVHFTDAELDTMINNRSIKMCGRIEKNPNINVFNNIFETFLASYDWQKNDYEWLPTLNSIINSKVCKETIPEDAIEGVKYLKCVFDDIAKGTGWMTEYDQTVMVWFIEFAKCWLNNEHHDLPYFNKEDGFF